MMPGRPSHVVSSQQIKQIDDDHHLRLMFSQLKLPPSGMVRFTITRRGPRVEDWLVTQTDSDGLKYSVCNFHPETHDGKFGEVHFLPTCIHKVEVQALKIYSTNPDLPNIELITYSNLKYHFRRFERSIQLHILKISEFQCSLLTHPKNRGI